VGPLLNEVGVLTTQDAEKESYNAFFASVFRAKAGHQESQALEVTEEAWRKDNPPLFKEDCVRSLKQSGHPQIHGPQWNVPSSTEGAGKCHC